MVADCKSAGLTPYVGSNPTPTTQRGSKAAGRRDSWLNVGLGAVEGEGANGPLPDGPAAPPTRGCSSVGRASAFQAEGRGFESRRPLARVAQLVEHILGKDEVIGSIPIASSVKWMAEGGWQKAVNSTAHPFDVGCPETEN